MKNVIIAVTATLGMLLASLFVAAPAQAGNFNDVYHAADDSGYTAPIQIQCSDGRRFYLYKGDASLSRCGFHVERIIVGYNQTVRCTDTVRPWQGWLTFYTGNYNYVANGASLRCYMQRPL